MSQPDRLASGIKVTEAIERAAKWWGEFRGMIPREFAKKREERTKVFRATDSGLLLKILDKDWDRSVDSGILRGLPWGELKPSEQVEVVRCWHDLVLLDGHDDGRVVVDP